MKSRLSAFSPFLALLCAFAAAGGDIVLDGDGGENLPGFMSEPMQTKPGGCYRFSFAVRREKGAGGCMTSGFKGLNVDVRSIGTQWKEVSYVLGLPSDATSLPVKFGLWKVDGTCIVRDGWKVEEVTPRYSFCDGSEIGTGELLLGREYHFSSPWKDEGHTHSRTLQSFRNMTFNSAHFDFAAGGEMVWRFGIGGRRLSSGTFGFTRGWHKKGALSIEISADGATWRKLSRIESAGDRTDSVEIPADVFPREHVWVRISADKGSIRLIDVNFKGTIEGKPAWALGETKYAPPGETVPQFDAPMPRYMQDRTGAILPGGNAFLSLWRESSGSKVAKFRSLPAARESALTLRTARNEAEAVQLVLNAGEDLSGVAATLKAPLADGKGNTIPQEAVEILRVAYVNVKIPSSPANPIGYYPDPLPPQTPGLSVGGGENQPFWIRVKPSKETPAGIYRSSIAVSGRRADGSPFSCETPFEVEVFDFTLPDEMTCRSLFGINIKTAFSYHAAKTEEEKEQVREMYLKAMCDYHLSPYSPALDIYWKVRWSGIREARKGDLSKLEPQFNFAKWDAAMEHALSKYHFNAFREGGKLGIGKLNAHDYTAGDICGFKDGTPAYEIMLEKLLKGYSAHLKEKGWDGKVLLYPYDEPKEKADAFIMAGYRKLKRHVPELPILLASHIRSTLVGGPDIWCPTAPNLHSQCGDERRAAGDKFWWYVCMGPKPPYPGLFIDNPGVDLRLWLWQSWGEGILGVLVWHVNIWTTAPKYPDPAHPQNPYEDAMSWNRTGVPWGNGDGRFLYPPLAAANGLAKEFVPAPPVGSVRGEMLRDGMEDYEYFAMLKRLLAAKGANLDAAKRASFESLLAVPPDVYRSLTDYNKDPAAMEAHRTRLARAISELSAFHGK